MKLAVDQSMDGPEHLSLAPQKAAEEIARRAIVHAAQLNRRLLIGLAGGPGSGKSTLAGDVVGILNTLIDGSAARLPMDGFHMTTAKLTELGLLEEKGTPHTFEAQAFVDFLKKLKAATGPVACPSYSRRIESVVPDAFTIAGNVPIIVVEGNYLLLEESPWDGIRDLLDFAVYLDLGKELAETRLLKRHAEHGLFTEERNQRHVAQVDLPNYDLADESKSRADLIIDLMTDT